MVLMMKRSIALALSSILTLAFAEAQEEVGYPKNQLLKLQDSQTPEMVHVKCRPTEDGRIKCNRIEIKISSPNAIDLEELRKRFEEDWDKPGGIDYWEDSCKKIIEEIPASESAIRSMLDGQVSAQVDKDYQKKLLDHAVAGILAMREQCDFEPTVENFVAWEAKNQAREKVVCDVSWMPDYEKTYTFDKVNQLWTYTLDSDGLCGRQITIENIRKAPAQNSYGHELEILTLYPDLDDRSQCKLGIKPKQKKKIYSIAPTKYFKECLYFKAD